MANWTEIPNSSLEVEAPIRSVDGFAFRDNPIAIAEGATGAPKIANNAFSDNTIHGNKLINGTVHSAKLQKPTGGLGYLIKNVNETGGVVNSTGYSLAEPGVANCLIPGVITAYLQFAGDGYYGYAQILKNGVEVATWSTTSSSYVTHSISIGVALGDLIEFKFKVNYSNNYVRYRRLRIYSNNPSFAVA